MNKLETNLIPIVKGFFHKQSGTISYVVIDSTTNLCAILDTVLDFNYSTGSIFFEHADTVIDFVNENKLDVEWLIETHVHADHLSAAPYKEQQKDDQHVREFLLTTQHQVYFHLQNQ